ncbi:hypothetical protein [Nannocystis radixulma]|uniref:Uncharacterized protein n=1 Tax=Nannocystis radixulma TaxID=2995305 RepID=A0ABT5BEX1_9BACT|nr:hypothetical protein [Nannocystis radixulma]MDC0672686.1 hypothetical protein [Nannocystis radixulma]
MTELAWEAGESPWPSSLLGWLFLAFVAMWSTGTLVFCGAALVWFVATAALDELRTVDEAIAMVMMSVILAFVMVLMGAFIKAGVQSFRRDWAFCAADESWRGQVETWLGRVIASHGTRVVSITPLMLAGSVPSAAEVEAAGTSAVARALEPLLPPGTVDKPGSLAGEAVLVLAAVLHLAARGVVQLDRVALQFWRRPKGHGGEHAILAGAGDVWHVRAGEGSPAPQTVESMLWRAMVGPQTREGESAEGQSRRASGAPYRDAGPARVAARGGPLRLDMPELFSTLQARVADSQPAEGSEAAAAVAARLGAAVVGNAEFAAGLIAEATRLRRNGAVSDEYLECRPKI